MISKNELLNQTKNNLIKKIFSLKSYCSNLKRLLLEYKATTLLQQRQMDFQRKKLEFWEKPNSKRTYSYLGSKHNRDIGTLKRANAKRRYIDG